MNQDMQHKNSMETACFPAGQEPSTKSNHLIDTDGNASKAKR
jgi:hypothetical protein